MDRKNNSTSEFAVVTSPEKIQAFIREAIIEVLERRLPQLVKKATQKEWLTREEVKDLTGWSDRTLQHLRDSGQIEYSQHGRKILYPTEEFMEFLDDHRIESGN